MIRVFRENTERSLLLVILLLAAAMRFYSITTLSLSNEELSLITRIKESSFSDFFKVSNLGESGPAGFPVFLFLWMKIFGYSVFMIRLPFVISGILTIYFTYKLAEKWFNSHSALFIAASLCFLEFTLLYSQTARSYGPGLFFTILAIYFWTKFFHEKETNKKNMLLFAIAFAIASYIHYFALIFLGLVYISGMFFLKKDNFKWYFIALISFLVIYAANIPVIIHQLSNPGESWLSVPDHGWFFEHIKFIFNDSEILLYLVLAIFIVSNIASFGEIKFGKYHILSLAWFVIPVVYGVYYSLWIEPVLENAVMIFSFPFLLFFLFSFIRKEYKTYNFIALALFLFIGIYSSACEKKYYSSCHFGEFRDIAKKTIEWNEEVGISNITNVININAPSYINYYMDRFDRQINFEMYRNDGKTDLNKLRHVIDSSETPYFLYAWSSVYNPSESAEMITVKYPYLLRNSDYNGMAGISLYSATDSANAIASAKPVYYVLNGFEEKNTWDKDTSVLDTQKVMYGKYSVRLDHKDEYGPSSNSIISKMTDKPISRITVSLWAYAKGVFKDAQLVATMNFRDDENRVYENYLWLSTKFEYFIEKDEWGQVFFSFDLPELRSRNDELKIYVWNPDKDTLYIDNIEIKAFE